MLVPLQVLLGFCFSVVAPLVVGVTCAYFVTAWIVWRYCALYVYERSYESGGQMFPLVYRSVLRCLYISTFFTGAAAAHFKGRGHAGGEGAAVGCRQHLATS